jgi:hypothetical protein
MVVQKVNDIEFREADYYTDSDVALVLRDWELQELKNVLEQWVVSAPIMQSNTMARIVNAIKEFDNELQERD